jgi:hypothetical protein
MSATGSKSNEKKGTTKQPREGSVIWAAIQVLDGKRRPMTPAEILAEIQERKLAKKLEGKTPEASVAARLAVHTAQGLYFERPEKGKYQLKKGVTAKSVFGDSAPAAKPAADKSARGERRKPASRPTRAQQQPADKPAKEAAPEPAATTA